MTDDPYVVNKFDKTKFLKFLCPGRKFPERQINPFTPTILYINTLNVNYLHFTLDEISLVMFNITIFTILYQTEIPISDKVVPLTESLMKSHSSSNFVVSLLSYVAVNEPTFLDLSLYIVSSLSYRKIK